VGAGAEVKACSVLPILGSIVLFRPAIGSLVGFGTIAFVEFISANAGVLGNIGEEVACKLFVFSGGLP
jgi:hypothetical protein